MLAKSLVRTGRPVVLLLTVLLVVYTFFRFPDSLSPSSYQRSPSTARQKSKSPQKQRTKLANVGSEYKNTLYAAGSEYKNTLYAAGSNEDIVVPRFNYSTPCADFPDTSGIAFVLKTGDTELFDRLPTHIATSLQCLPNTLIFSDMEQQVGSWHVYDALQDVDKKIKATAEEFNLYRSLHDCPVSQRACVRARGHDAWKLDKYKFLHMVVRTWQMQPGRDWYVFAEADTYVVWPNMVRLLHERIDQDPEARLFVGSVSLVNNFPFAHGGSGYVMSGALIRDLVENNPDLAHTYDLRAREHIYGDLVLAYAVHERAHVHVSQAFPMFNGEKPASLPFGHGQWCEPIITMHHLDPDELGALWQFEQTRINKDFPLLIKDIYNAFVGRHLVKYRQDWDNLSDDICYIDPDPDVQERVDRALKGRQKSPDAMNAVEKKAHRSIADCALVCEFDGIDVDEELQKLESDEHVPSPTDDNLDERLRLVYGAAQNALEDDWAFKVNRRCFQWRYREGECCISHSFKLGEPRPDSSPRDTSHSGWYLKGISDWIHAKGECTGAAWKSI